MCNTVKEYAEKYGFDESNNFAAACLSQNTVEDLACIVAVVNDGGIIEDIADVTDCKSWGITPIQWYEGIKAALREIETDLLGKSI